MKIGCIGIGMSTPCFEGVDSFRDVILRKDKFELNALHGHVGESNEDFNKKLLDVVAQAIKDAELNIVDENSDRIAVIIGTSLGNMKAFQTVEDEQVCLDIAMNSSLNYIAKVLGIKGPCFCTTNTCVSGVNAISIAEALFFDKCIDYAIVVGIDEISDFILSGFRVFEILSEKSSFQAFERDRDGIILASGAGAIVLTSLEQLPCNRCYCTILATSITNDASHLMAPERYASGMILAINKCLQQAGIPKEMIDCVFVGANGTKYNDIMYSTAVKEIWKNKTCVSSLKHFLGHTLGASSILELIGIMILMEHSFIPATLEKDKLDEGFADLNIVLNPTLKKTEHVMLLVNGFSGSNGAIVVKRGRKNEK